MKAITLELFEKYKKEEEMKEQLGIRIFPEPSGKWMQKHPKYRMRLIFNLGVWHVNWDKIEQGR